MSNASSLLAAMLLLCVCPMNRAAESTPAQKLIASARVLIVAHRGNSSVAPENTLAAFDSAIAAGADLVELDYHHSSDGVPVVIHDPTLDRTTNAEQVLGSPKMAVNNVSAADLAKLDAATWFGSGFTAARLPTLTESLDRIQAGSMTLIERKAGDAATLVKLLEEKKLTDRVVVQAFDWEFVAACRKLSPTLTLATLHGKPATAELVRKAVATGADIIVWNHEKINHEEIALIHQLGKRAWVYTVDDPQKASDLIAAGIDGIITNKPAAMLKLRDQVKRPTSN